MTFAVDPKSTITVSRGNDNRGGFAVLPMSFTPQFDVALDDADQIRYAAQAINLMAQQTTVALGPNVTTLEAAIAGKSGLLVAASGGRLSRSGKRPPLLMTSTTAVDVNGAPVTGINVNGPLGVIEAFPNNGRMILAVDTSGDPALLDRSFDHIRGLDGRWGTLAGDVVATGAAGNTTELAVLQSGSIPDPVTPPTEGWPWWTWLLVAGGAVALPAVMAAVIVFWRRAQR